MKGAPRLQKIARLILVAVFVTAAQGQAVGLRHCSLHDALPGLVQPSPGASVPGTRGHDHGASHDGGSPVAGESHEHGEGPAGCLDECQTASNARAAPTGAPIVLAGGIDAAPGSILRSGVFLGARHLPFELHLPNAPPSFG